VRNKAFNMQNVPKDHLFSVFVFQLVLPHVQFQSLVLHDWGSVSVVAVSLVSTSMSHKLYSSEFRNWNGTSSPWMGQMLSGTKHTSVINPPYSTKSSLKIL
jgi:hypothetical protein